MTCPRYSFPWRLATGLVVALLLLAAAPQARCAEEEPNLVTNPSFEEGNAGWTLPATYTVVDDVAHSGKRSLRVVNTDPDRYLLASQPLKLKPGMMYRFSAWVRAQGVQGNDTGATICVEWYGEKGFIGGTYPGGIKGDRDWYRIEAVTPPIPEAATRCQVTLYLRKKMTGTAWFDDVSVVAVYPPALDAALVFPNYRGILWPDSDKQQVVLRGQVGAYLKGGLRPEQMTLAGSLLDGEKVIDERRIRQVGAGMHEVTLNARGLRPGNYIARMELLAPDGKPLERKEFAVRKLAPGTPRPKVYIDEHNRTIVDGKPFFPLGWYFGPGPGNEGFQEHIDRVAESPFNTIMCYGINYGGQEKVRAYLDYLHQRGVKLIYSIKDVYEGTRYYHNEQLGFKGEENIVRGIVTTFRDHPAVLAWYLNDELPLAMRDRLEARQRLVTELDPEHPTWAVLYQVGELFGYLGTADVLGTDPYPVPTKPVTLAGDWTRQSAAASGGKRPLWQVPQAFDWGNYQKDEADKYRAPTLSEERVMTYLCLINGAHGLIYYSYSDLLRDPLGFERRWADMLLVGKEVKQLEPALISARPAPKVEVQIDGPARDAVEWMARADDAGATYILLANPDPEKPATARVGVPRGAQVLLLDHHGTRTLPEAKDARMRTVSLEPMGAVTVILKPGRAQGR